MRDFFAAALAAALFACALPLHAATFTSSDQKFMLEFGPRWTSQEADSAENVLNLEANGASFSISRMDENPDIDQLRTLLQAELLSLRSKGYAVPGEPKEFRLPSGPLMIYAVYLGGNDDVAAGFFNLGGMAFAISAVGMKEDELLRTMQTLHRPGEEIAAAPVQRKYKPKTAEPPPLPAAPAYPAPASTEAINNLLGAAIDTAAPAQQAVPATPEPPQPATPAPEQPARPDKTPLYPRAPLPLAPLAILLALWGAGTVYASSAAKKLPPVSRVDAPPQNPPPDYNFPYALHVSDRGLERRFDFSGADGARYCASCNCLLDKLAAYALYGLLAFEFAWTCLYMIGLDLAHILLPLPGGAVLASFPELPFLAVAAIGLILRLEQEYTLQIRDEQSNIVLELSGTRSEAQFKNAEGNLVGKLSKTPAGGWQVHASADGPAALELVDIAPQLKPLRRIFGNLGGLLNARHVFQSGGKLAGTVLQSSSNDSDLTLEFAFSAYRAARPDQIVASLLYVKAVERDYPYPWFF